ncbi:cathepsin L1-like [Mizuhopecten yessoensis]|uniref:Digestive cysteine proteinase 2 n=1 Tax=Mizuhopecten yessoensis TaxID=6573 RepID=A0A210QWF2_MIZYE|nr:cathepsin L1-like [Mizuhopecten yessoensis]OWF53098.1 Digestive cysteine proteinase 2 [Mizuhopecten yessoensis]
MVLTTAKVVLVLFTVTVVTAGNIDVAREWREWKQRYNKVYSNQTEETERRHAWERAFYYIRHHGNRPGDLSFSVGMNSRADMLPRDYRSEVNELVQGWSNSLQDNSLVYVPTSFDWRTRGVIAPVSNQGQIGSSISIVVTETLESSEAIQTGHMVRLSEREISDCCGGGGHLMGNVFNCLHDIGGVCSEAGYPNQTGPARCRNDSCTPMVKVQGGVKIPSGREDLLQQHLLDQPIMAMIDASHASFQMYKRGIYFEEKCSSTSLDHAVQVVGFGVEDGKDFWIVKNSWGINWGIHGYILMSRNRNNQCGIASAASFPALG